MSIIKPATNLFYNPTILILLLILVTTSTYSQTWTQNRCMGGSFTAGYVATDNIDNLLLYHSGKIYRSQDGCDTLIRDESFANFGVPKFRVCSQQPDSLYLFGVQNGEKKILFSSDQGLTFEDRTPVDPGLQNYNLTLSRNNPNLIAHRRNDGILISYDAGVSWDFLENVPPYFANLTFHPQNDSTFYLCGMEYDEERGVYVSTDSGLTWVKIDELDNNDFYVNGSIFIDSFNPNIMFAEARGQWDDYLGWAKSVDGGVHWDVMGNDFDILGYDYDGSMLFFRDNGLYTSNDGAVTFMLRLAENGTLPLDGYSPSGTPDLVLTHPLNRNVFYVSRSDMLFRTLDGGLTWNWVGFGVDDLTFKKIFPHPSDENKLILMGNSVWEVNRDNSNMNLLCMNTLNSLQFSAELPSSGLRMAKGFLSRGKRLEITSDNGQIWTDISETLGNGSQGNALFDAAMINSDPNILFAIKGYYICEDEDEEEYYRSMNSGQTWEPLLGFDGPGSFIPDPYNPDRMYIENNFEVISWDASTSSFMLVNEDMRFIDDIQPLTGEILELRNHQLRIYSEDSNTYDEIDPPTFSDPKVLMFFPFNPNGILYCSVLNELYISENRGESWTQVNLPDEINTIYGNGIFLDENGDLYIVGTSGGYWVGRGIISLGVGNQDEAVPVRYFLFAPYPNPFNSTIHIPFNVSQAGSVTFRIYDLLGREVTVMEQQMLTASKHRISWDTQSRNISSGTYIIQMEAGSFSSSKRIQLVK